MNKFYTLILIFLSIQIVLNIFTTASVGGSIDCNKITESKISTDPEIRFGQAYCLYEKGAYRKAVDYLENLESSLPVLTDYIIYFRSTAQLKMNNFDKAISGFRTILDDYNSTVLYVESLAMIAEIHEKEGKLNEAISTYNKLVALESSSWLKSRYINRIAEIYEVTGKREQALEIYKQIWINYPQTNYSEKVVEASNALGAEFKPSVSERKARADKLFEMGLYNRALEEYLELPGTEETNTRIAICLFYNDREEQSLEILNETNTPESHFWRGKLLERSGLTEDALRSYYTAYLFFPNSELAQKSLMISAELNKSRGEYDQAMEKYNKIVTKHPRSGFVTDAIWNTGWIHYLKGDYDEALRKFSGNSYPEYSLEDRTQTQGIYRERCRKCFQSQPVKKETGNTAQTWNVPVCNERS